MTSSETQLTWPSRRMDHYSYILDYPTPTGPNPFFFQERLRCIEAIGSRLRISSQEEPKIIVYAALNKINGKLYIGITEKGLRVRKYSHIWRAKNGLKSKFASAIRKYGEESFEWVILIKCRDYWDALRREAWIIEDLKPEYNMTAGGGGIKGYKFPPEIIAKCVEGRRGKTGHPCPQWLKEKNAALRRAEKGKFRSEACQTASSKNIRKAIAAKVRSVVCVTDGKVYNSVSAAAAEYGLTTGQISHYCNTNCRSRRGLVFKHAERKK